MRRVDGHRVGGDDLLLPRIAHRLEAPGAEREHDRLELAAVGRQLVDDDARARHPADDAGRLQLLEPRRQDVARDARQPRGELSVAARPDEQVADDEQGPALAHELQGPRDAAVLPVVACGHRPQACWFAKASGPCSAATGSIQPNSRMLPSGSVSWRWYMKP